MKVEDIVGSVLLLVSGGKPVSELSVHAHDIKAYIPDVINDAMGVRINEEYGVEPGEYPNGLFVNVLESIPVLINSRNLKYAFLPQRPLSVRGGKSVVAVGEQGGKQFTRILHDEGTLGSFYWKSRTDVTTFDVEGQTVVFYNIPASVSSVYAKVVVHIDTIGFTDEVFIPSGMETTIINALYNRVMQQRVNPKDTVIDGEDIR